MEVKKVKPRLLICDFWNILIGLNAVSNILDDNSNQIGMYLGSMGMVRMLIDKYKPHKVILAMDGPNAGEARRKLYPGYKGGSYVKNKTSSVIIKEGEEEDEYSKYTSQEAFTAQLGLLYEFVKTLPISIVIVPYCEADDIITHIALKNKNEYDCIIVSGDKDYCQLIQDGIRIYNWREKILYNENAFISKFNIIPQNYIFMKILLGDNSDQIKGVKGIGKKTFPLFYEILNKQKYNDVGEFVEATKLINLDNASTREKNSIKTLYNEDIIKHMALLYRVMHLDDNYLKLNQIDILRLQLEQQNQRTCSRLSATIIMQKHQFNKLYNGFDKDKWIQSFIFLRPNVLINI